VHVTTFTVWTCLGLAVVFWGRLWWSTPPTPLALPPASAKAEVDVAAVASALGGGAVAAADSPVVPTAQPLRLIGVAAQASGVGVALIQETGQRVRPFQVGDVVTEGWRLDALGHDHARLVSTTEHRQSRVLHVVKPGN
jgi:hypothetical protein